MRIVNTFCQLCTILFLKNIIIKLYEKHNDFLFDKLQEWYEHNSTNPLCKILLTFISDFIYIYSLGQIYFYRIKINIDNNILPFIRPVLEKYKLIESSTKYSIEVYIDNNQFHRMTFNGDINKQLFENVSELKTLLENKKGCIVIVTDCYNITGKKQGTKICYNRLDNSSLFIHSVSNIKFLYVSLTYNNQTYPIELCSHHFNFYIVDNVVDKVFILYYLKYILNIQDSCDNDNIIYTLSICDHNASFVTITNEDFVIIEKDGYKMKYNTNSKLEKVDKNEVLNSIKTETETETQAETEAETEAETDFVLT